MGAIRTALGPALACLFPTAVPAGPAAMDCTGEVVCEAGADCATSGTDFALLPDGAGYSSFIDAGEVKLVQVSPEAAEVRSFAAGGAQSVTVLLSLFPDNRFALTVHEEIDGPHVETVFGTCRPEV
jgi:hypothetical protein